MNWRSPLYLLVTWLMNPITIITTFPQAVKAVMGHGSGKWVSPVRRGELHG